MGRAACISCWWTIVRRKAPRGAASSPPGDEDLWQALAATAKPIKRTRPAPASKPVAKVDVARPRLRAAPVMAAPKQIAAEPLANMDKRNAERLRRGEMVIDGTIDLHGMTQDAAHAALDRFLAHSVAAGRRCLLVITGKGLRGPRDDAGIIPERRGVLKTMVPRWLTDTHNRGRVLAHCAARPQHGGSGALYVLLRRQRDRT